MPKTIKLVIRIACLLTVFATGAMPLQGLAAGSAMLELIEILHNKGSLTGEEYRLLKEAAMTDGERQEAGKETPAPAGQAAAPSGEAGWASKISLKGDIRLRYQGQDTDPGPGRDRGRLRYRLGIIARPTAGWEAGAGLASGSDDLRSTNQTFTDTFSTKGINLDYAYARYRFNDNISLIGGKFKFADYLYTASDLIWDGDINPEGFSAGFTRPSGAGTTFANGGIWVLSENGGSGIDPYLVYAQLGQRFGSDSLFGTIAGTYYSFQDNTALGDFKTDGTNSDYRFGGVFSLSGEIGLKDLLGNGTRASIMADWVSNNDTVTDRDNGYLVGLKASNGPWSFSYSYMRLEQNAWPDILPDSDRFDGLTGIKGHEIALSYALMKNVALGIDYYAVSSTLTDEDQDLLQLDVNVKF